FQDPVVVAVEGLRFATALVAVCRGLRGELAERTLLAIARPVKPILLARAADNALRIDPGSGTAVLVRIFIFGVHKSENGLDRVKLVASNAAVQNFLPSRSRVELPALFSSDQRYRKRGIILANDYEH